VNYINKRNDNIIIVDNRSQRRVEESVKAMKEEMD